MIRTLWNTLEYIQNYTRIMIELWELSRVMQRLTHISVNAGFLGDKNYLMINKRYKWSELFGKR